jgi:hypothetical protein
VGRQLHPEGTPEAFCRYYFRTDPGDFSGYLRQYSETNYFATPPGTVASYGNLGFRLLGELYANAVEGNPDAYAAAARRLIADTGTGGDVDPVFPNGRAASIRLGEAPGHPQFPGHAWNRFERPPNWVDEIGCLGHFVDAETPGGPDVDLGAIDDIIDPPLPDDIEGSIGGLADPEAPNAPRMISPVYARDGAYAGGSGGMCLPIVAVARILSALTPDPGGGGTYLPVADLRAATLPNVLPPPEFALGFECRDAEFTWPPWTRPAEVIRIFKSGFFEGCGAMLAHQLPKSETAGQDRTLSFCVVFNQWIEMGPATVREIFQVLQEMVTAGELPDDVDRFPPS